MKSISVDQIAQNCTYLIEPQSFTIVGGTMTVCWINSNGIPVMHVTGYNENGQVLTDDYYTF
jgi:hypothetical protein